MLAVIALAVGAAGLDEVRLSSAGGDADADQPVEVGDTTRDDDELEEGDGSPSVSPWYLLVFLVVSALATLGLAWRRDVQIVWLATIAMLLLLVALFLVASTGDSSTVDSSNWSQATESPNGTLFGSGSGTEANSGAPATVLTTGALLFVGVILGVGVVIGFSRAATSGAGDRDGADEAGSGDSNAAEIADAAGRAADSLAGADDLDNPVYRAWRDMTTVLADEPDSTLTPAEFRDRALAAGLPPEPIDTLTEVFRDVRYGSHEVTAHRQAAALGALRDVERAAERVADEAPVGTDRGAGAGVAGGHFGREDGRKDVESGRKDVESGRKDVESGTSGTIEESGTDESARGGGT